jgi:hypothetical protein
MSKLFKGDLLIFTNKGLVRADNLNKEEHLILCIDNKGLYYYDEIEELVKIYKNKYTLNKLSFNNNINSYLVNDNIIIKSIQNIPNSVETPEISEYLNYNESRCKVNSKIGDLSSFDFIEYPTNINIKDNVNKIENGDYYRFQGLYISTNEFTDEITNKEVIDFISNYLISNNIKYQIIENKFFININEKINKISLYDLFILSKEHLLIFTKSLIEINNELNIKNKENYYIIKYAYLLYGVYISSYYNNEIIIIKIPRKRSDSYYYYFNYNNNIYNKIRNIKKIQSKGFLYSLKLKKNNFYLTDLGFIS